MILRPLDCLAPAGETSLPIHVLRPTGLPGFLDALLPPLHAAYLRAIGFDAGGSGSPVLLAAPTGIAAAVLGIGKDTSPMAFGGLARALPAAIWHFEPGDYDVSAACLGFCLGAYDQRRTSGAAAPPPRLAITGHAAAIGLAETIWFVRDLINTPANRLGPSELAAAAQSVGHNHGAVVHLCEGEELSEGYPAIAAVGAASDRPPCVVVLHWRGSAATDTAPLISLCGKGVVFDSGGLDIKPSLAMLRMKKDMGGAAVLLGVAREIMRRDLPIRLALRLGCVENAISGRAMRPGDVLRTRAGLMVEVGNTDAEGRLVLADLLCDAASESPAILIDCATLTGAARVATGPDLPALFCNHDRWAEAMLAAGTAVHDPLWRLPLWDGYDPWLASQSADFNTVSSKPFAGAIVAALFLRRFVPPAIPWAHLDAYCWNDTDRPGRPEGGEAHTLRAIVAAIDLAAASGLMTASFQ